VIHVRRWVDAEVFAGPLDPMLRTIDPRPRRSYAPKVIF
jgi:hypothetical protein